MFNLPLSVVFLAPYHFAVLKLLKNISNLTLKTVKLYITLHVFNWSVLVDIVELWILIFTITYLQNTVKSCQINIHFYNV